MENKLWIEYRIKDKDNNICKYVLYNGKDYYESSIIEIYNLKFENAIILKNGLVKAKNGYTIKTLTTNEYNNFLKIRARKNGLVGKPATYSHFENAKLSKTQKFLLDLLKDKDNVILGKNEYNIKIRMTDLSCLSAETRLEYSLFERPDRYWLFKGTTRGININESNTTKLINGKYKWIGHTHVGYDTFCLYRSPSDIDTLKKLNQEMSSIYNCVGQHTTFYIEG